MKFQFPLRSPEHPTGSNTAGVPARVPILALLLVLSGSCDAAAQNADPSITATPPPAGVVPSTEAGKRRPPSAAAQEAFASGMAKYRIRDHDGAIADFDRALAIDPGYIQACHLQGMARKSKGDLDGALANFERVIELNPRYPQAYLNRGSVKMTKGNLDGAIADYERAIEIAPRDPASFLARAAAKQRKGDVDGAIADYDRAIEINPRFAAAINGRAAAKRASEKQLSGSSFYPFRGRDLSSLRSIVRAEVAPPTRDLAQAWEYHGKFKGSWMQNAAKPASEVVAAFDAFKQALEARKLPAWFTNLSSQPGRTFQLALASAEGDSTFREQKESEETQQVKALAIVYLTEHELNRPGAANKGATFISSLLARTPWDWELHSLYARFLLDARVQALAWQEACLGLYLNPEPTRSDLGFVAFVGFVCARNRWEDIKQMFREAAANASDAEAVIAEWGPRFDSGSGAKAVNVPVPRPQDSEP